MNPGWKTSEFWLNLLAHIAPAIVSAVVAVIAPGAPLAVAAVAAVTSVAGHYAAGKYTDARTGLKQAAQDAVAAAAPVILNPPQK